MTAPHAMDANTRIGWEHSRAVLRATLGDAVFSSWFNCLALDEVSGGEVQLSVPTKFLKKWLQSRYEDILRKTLSNEFPAIKRVSINVRSSTRQATACASARCVANSSATASSSKRPALAESKEVEPLTGSPLDRRLIFSNFLVSGSNKLAHLEAQRIASASCVSNDSASCVSNDSASCVSNDSAGPADPLLYNPLYLHASVGLGKTHLLQAIATFASRRRVIYLTAERFMYGFFSAIKTHTEIAFKEKLRAIDVLVIDDIQFLQGKSIQQEFCHTLNALIDSRRQIVIAADRPPGDLEHFEKRVQSRLSGGLCIEIGPPEEDLRIKILEARVAAATLVYPTFEVLPEVIAYVASVIRTNGRDLDGAVNRLLAHAGVASGAAQGFQHTIETAELAVRDLVRTPDPRRVKIEDIQKLVACHFNVSRDDILSARRTANVVRPRQIAMYLSKVLTPRSLPEIGRRFGGRDHTTVLHGVRKIEGLRQKDAVLDGELNLLSEMLRS